MIHEEDVFYEYLKKMVLKTTTNWTLQCVLVTAEIDSVVECVDLSELQRSATECSTLARLIAYFSDGPRDNKLDIKGAAYGQEL